MAEITERVIANSGLTREEKKVARHYFNLPSAGKRTHRWAESLRQERYIKILDSARSKIFGAGK